MQFSIIIPTLWKSIRIYKLLEDLFMCDLVGEILLIDNSNSFDISKFTYNYKLKIIEVKENVYVNPAWNLGVSLAKYDNICICNDDINFDTRVFSYIDPFLNIYGIVGQSISNYGLDLTDYNPDISKIEYISYGWGCLLFIKKGKYIHIPETLKIYCGDNYLATRVEGGPYLLTGLPIKTEMSTTSNDEIFSAVKNNDYHEYKNLN